MKALFAGLPQRFAAPSRPQAAAVLDGAWQSLVEMAELGRRGGHAETTLRQQAQRLGDSGFPALAQTILAALESGKDVSSPAFLTAVYAVALARGRTLDLPRLEPIL
ncbi:hypothetical protein ABI_24140 [Asticcacaulis biprosthecium C19]|uniref:Uncharacterized protein n=1 Tax=Asticcacaulis biprosthecium C19 TaxID=715226 RepID=F4QNU3_9CAUL|nr:hypothetical protein [Asticcacaulis biprosthecium]EGF91001.1 hypothetical protein ABI_24140 [Asticcacaulis biprosthecium C19]